MRTQAALFCGEARTGNGNIAVDRHRFAACRPYRNKGAACQRADAWLGIHCQKRRRQRTVDSIATARRDFSRRVSG